MLSSEYSEERYGSWHEVCEVVPKFVVYANDNSAIDKLTYNYESVSFLDQDKKPDFSEPFYLITGVYRSGDSFGYKEGNVEFFGLTQNPKFARKLVSALENNKNEYSIVVDGVVHGIPWFGYFDSLTHVDYDVIEVKKNV
jgi:hypothetical protein